MPSDRIRAQRWKQRAIRAENHGAMLELHLKNVFDDKIYNELQIIHDIRRELIPIISRLNTTLQDIKHLYEMSIKQEAE